MSSDKERQEAREVRELAKVEIGEAGQPNLIEMVWQLYEEYHEKKLARLLDVDTDTVQWWKRGRSTPNSKNAKKIEKLFWDTFPTPR